MEKCYVEVTYTNSNYRSAKIAVVAVPAEDGRLIADTAKVAKKKLEETIGEKVEMLDFSYLGRNILIID